MGYKKGGTINCDQFESAVKDINTLNRLVSQNSNNKQFITEIGQIMPQENDACSSR